MKRTHLELVFRKLPFTVFTEAGLNYKKQCAISKVFPDYVPGVHYVAEENEDRILLPDVPALGGLRHRWMWARRPRLHIPTWNYAKLPKSNIAPEENARLLSVYMRPWTLHPPDESEHVPLLNRMAECVTSFGGESSTVKGQGHAQATTLDAVNSSTAASPTKRRRLRAQKSSEAPPLAIRKSYAETWQRYINGNVVAHHSKRLITNLLAATAARVVVRADDVSSASDGSELEQPKGHAGNLGLVATQLSTQQGSFLITQFF